MSMNTNICVSIIFLHFKKPHLHVRNPHFSAAYSILFFSSSRRKQPKPSSQVFDYLFSKHGFSHETATKAASALAHLKEPEKCDAVLLFLKDNGFSQTHLERIVKSRPRILSSNLENTIMPKLKVFQDLGFTCKDIAHIISAHPDILQRSAKNTILPSILILEKLFGSIDQVCNVLKRSPYILCNDLGKTLLPNIQFLESFGISRLRMVRYISTFPRFFMIKPKRMKNIARRVDEMGFDRDSKMLIQAIRAVSMMSDKSWEQKLELFRSLGLSYADVLVMFRRMPLVIALSEKKIRKVLQLLIDTGKYEISYVVNHPELLLYSVERRLRPRLQVLSILESKNLLKKFPSMATIYAMSNEKFYKDFVSPYLSEVGLFYPKRATAVRMESNTDAGCLKCG